jgi:hypothetical protein
MLVLLSHLLTLIYRRIVGQQPSAERYRGHRQAAVNKECRS